MSKSAADLRREQRKKELEEKRAKLKAYRDKSTTDVTAVNNEPEPAKENDLTKIAAVASVNDLLDALDIPSTNPNLEKEIKKPETPTESNDTKNQKITTPLVLQQRVVDHSVPPKIIPTYAKGTQTVSVQVDDFDDIPSISNNNEPSHQKNTFEENKSESKSQKSEDGNKFVELPEIEIQRVLYSKELADFLEDATRMTERARLINSKFDILQNYKGDIGDSQLESDTQISLISKLYDDRWSKNRAVTSLDWSPKFAELILTSYSENKLSTQEADGVVLVWTVNNLLERPEFVFNCQSPVLTAKFPVFQPNIIVGGTYSGQLVLWDTRAKSTPVQRSPLSNVGHTHPIYCLDVVGTKNAHNLISISTDGTLCSWSLSNLSQPIEQIKLEVPPVGGRSVKNSSPAATCLTFEKGQVNQFFVGTEEGAVYHGARHGTARGIYERFSRAPVISSFDFGDEGQQKNVDYNFTGHCAPITAIDFQTAEGDVDLSSYFLTSSLDWSCKLWNKRIIDRPIATFQQGNDCVYDVKWSPKHPSVFATALGGGKLNIWNINKETEVPVVQEQASHHSINRLSWSEDSTKIAIGDAAGAVFVYDVAEVCSAESKDWAQFEEVTNNLPKPKSDVESADNF